MIAPDSYGGTLSASSAAEAIATGWRASRPDDELVLVPLADGGEGTLEVVARPGDEHRRTEVADPLGRPTEAAWLLRGDGTALIESAAACGLHLLTTGERGPLRTTSYGVGQLLEAAREAGARRIVVGLGGSASVDGGAGALRALGYRIVDDGGQGVKIGGRELRRTSGVEPRWLAGRWSAVEVTVWCDVRTPIAEAAATFGPQKGASVEAVEILDDGLRRWTEVVEADLGGRWSRLAGSGAAGGLGFGLAAGLGAELTSGAAAVAADVGLGGRLAGADLVITGEGRLDRTSGSGKLVGEVLEMARRAGVPAAAVVGRVDEPLEGLIDVAVASPGGPGPDPAREIAEAARDLAERHDAGNARR